MQNIDCTQVDQEEVVRRAAAALRAGHLIIFPTETTYGAGVDATNPAAVEKLLQYKARREGKPLSIAVTDLEMAEHFVELNEQARALYRQFLPGPVTVVSRALPEEQSGLAPGVASEFGTVGVRIPAYPLVLRIVELLGRPITATSANVSDQKRPYAIGDVLERISAKQASLIDLVLDAGTLPSNPPSTVIDTTLSTPITMRAGAISLNSAETTSAGSTVSTTTMQPHLASHPVVSTFHSTDENETKELAGRLLLKHWNAVRSSGLVVGLDGSLGIGKTIFAKGAAEFLKIAEPITSPTYSYIEEYDFTRHQTSGKFFHLDLWKIENEAELERLGINSLCGPQNVVVIEWFSQGGAHLVGELSKIDIPHLVLNFEQEVLTGGATASTPEDSQKRLITVYESTSR
jgi:L-threonylcarbamoyladenylate synthase